MSLGSKFLGTSVMLRGTLVEGQYRIESPELCNKKAAAVKLPHELKGSSLKGRGNKPSQPASPGRNTNKKNADYRLSKSLRKWQQLYHSLTKVILWLAFLVTLFHKQFNANENMNHSVLPTDMRDSHLVRDTLYMEYLDIWTSNWQPLAFQKANMDFSTTWNWSGENKMWPKTTALSVVQPLQYRVLNQFFTINISKALACGENW